MGEEVEGGPNARPGVLARLPGWLDHIASAGILPGDPEDLRLKKYALTLTSVLITVLSVIWVVTYGALGLWASAAIPLGYQVFSVASLLAFVRSKRYRLFRGGQLTLMLLLPFVLQWSLGGFLSSSAVAIWAFASPMGALVFSGRRSALRWFAAFVALLAVSVLLDLAGPVARPRIPVSLAVTFFALNVAGVATVTYSVLHYFVGERERAYAQLGEEREKSERLLKNVLPEAIAERLKEGEVVIADAFDDVTVLFADLADFTPLAERLPPDRVVTLLDDVFSAFDRLAEERGLEKIKTIGDAYMAAGGIPTPRPDHAEAVADLALGMLAEVVRRSRSLGIPLTLRIGIDTGPVVAGVIGRRRLIYDLWGDTVNIASRMESHGLPGRIQVTGRAYERLRDRYELEERGSIRVKGKGEMRTYLLIGPRLRTG